MCSLCVVEGSVCVVCCMVCMISLGVVVSLCVSMWWVIIMVRCVSFCLVVLFSVVSGCVVDFSSDFSCVIMVCCLCVVLVMFLVWLVV